MNEINTQSPEFFAELSNIRSRIVAILDRVDNTGVEPEEAEVNSVLSELAALLRTRYPQSSEGPTD